MGSIVKAMAIVAHPDDCVIFAWPFIEAHPEFEWQILYLTYTCQTPRGQEVRDYWNKRKVHTHFLGFEDDYQDQQTGTLTKWHGVHAALQISVVIADQSPDLILTHNSDGDYGHIHHTLVSGVVTNFATDTAKVYFASTFNYNTKYEVKVPVCLDELPLHKSVIEGFQDRNTGLYIVTEPAQQLLKQ